MGGAKRYPSISSHDNDGFREGLNPSYELSNILRTVGENRDLILKAWHDHFGN
jgi:hypothetical protein